MFIIPSVFFEQVQQEKVNTIWDIVQCLLSKSKSKFIGTEGLTPRALQHSSSMSYALAEH